MASNKQGGRVFTELDQKTLDRFSNYYAAVGLVSVLLSMAMVVLLLLSYLFMGEPAVDEVARGPQEFAWLWGVLLAGGVPNAWLHFKAAAGLQRRQHRALIFMAALFGAFFGVPCVSLGVGIWTVRVLRRPWVRAAFHSPSQARLDSTPQAAT